MNVGKASATVSVANAYTGKTDQRTVPSGRNMTRTVEADESYGWYDLTVTSSGDAGFRRQLAGHIEDGEDSMSDPLMGGLVHHD